MYKTLKISHLKDHSYVAILAPEDAPSFSKFLATRKIACGLPKGIITTEANGLTDSEVEFDIDTPDKIQKLVLQWMGYESYKDISLASDSRSLRWEYKHSNVKAYLVSLIQQYNKANNEKEPVRIYITDRIESDLASHLIKEGGKLGEQIKADGIQSSVQTFSKAQLVYGADEVRLE